MHRCFVAFDVLAVSEGEIVSSELHPTHNEFDGREVSQVQRAISPAFSQHLEPHPVSDDAVVAALEAGLVDPPRVVIERARTSSVDKPATEKCGPWPLQ